LVEMEFRLNKNDFYDSHCSSGSRQSGYVISIQFKSVIRMRVWRVHDRDCKPDKIDVKHSMFWDESGISTVLKLEIKNVKWLLTFMEVKQCCMLYSLGNHSIRMIVWAFMWNVWVMMIWIWIWI
jgi:hypothetical protein